MKLLLSMNNNRNYYPNLKSVRNTGACGKGMCDGASLQYQDRACHVDSHENLLPPLSHAINPFHMTSSPVSFVGFNRTGVPFLVSIFQWIFNSNRHTTINLFRNYIFEFPFCRELSAPYISFLHNIFSLHSFSSRTLPGWGWLMFAKWNVFQCFGLYGLCLRMRKMIDANTFHLFLCDKKNTAPLPSTVNMGEKGFSINIKQSQFILLLRTNWERE